MDCRGFQNQILAWIDGELTGDAASAAATHESACADCTERALAERAFEERLGTAMLSDVGSVSLATALMAARERVEAEQPASGRLLMLRRAVAAMAVAAAALIVVGNVMWFLCIPPFECAYLAAMEAAATDAPLAPLSDAPANCALLARVTPPAALGGFARVDDGDFMHVDYRTGSDAVRARYGDDDLAFTAIWSDLVGASPSFRRKVERDGLTWWVTEIDGRAVVAFICPKTRSLCALVGEASEERLIEAARTLRTCP